MTNLQSTDDNDALAEEEQGPVRPSWKSRQKFHNYNKDLMYITKTSSEKTKLMINSANGIQREIMDKIR